VTVNGFECKEKERVEFADEGTEDLGGPENK
jgi:hypothetical protein